MNVLVSMLLALTLAPQAPAAQTPAQAPPSSPSAQTVTPSPTSTPGAPTGGAQAVPAAPRAAPESYVIGANDSLQITVANDETMGLTNKYRVDETGMVTLPYLGRITAGGQTLIQFQQEVAKQLANGYIRNPQVRVDVDQYKSQIVYVTGAVRTPKAVQMQGNLTLMAALVEAGSPTSDASDDVQISHSKGTSGRGLPSPDPTDSDVRHVKLKDLNLGAGNFLLQDGDIVFVPTAKHFTITGQVRNTGSYVWEEGLTLDKAIARAGGMMDRGSTRGMQARRLVNGKMKDVDLNMQSLIQPDDVITIKQRIF